MSEEVEAVAEPEISLDDYVEEAGPLGPESTLKELFDEIRPEKGARAVPITMGDAGPGRAEMLIALSGRDQEVHILMANLMSYVDEMYQVAEQHQASARAMAESRNDSSNDDVPEPDAN